MTKALSNEWARSGVNVNAIAPGYMATKLTQDIKEKNPKQYQEITSRIPAGRWGTGEDLKGWLYFWLLMHRRIFLGRSFQSMEGI